MCINEYLLYPVILAYFLDLAFGDPYWFPHPVKGMGRAVTYFESRLRRIFQSQKFAGFLLVLIIAGGSYLIVWAIIKWAGRVNLWLQFGLSSFLIFTVLSTRSLGREAKKVYDALLKKNFPLAQSRVGAIVGRDTENLNEEEIIRATVESVAESSVDGIISPLFYALLGGAPLALAYKAVNTLDSMVGYKNKRYVHFGWFAAKLDDLANWIPARIGGLLIPLASFLLRNKLHPHLPPPPLRGRIEERGRRDSYAMRLKDIFQIVWKDGKKSPSPNAGIPQAAFAGALSIQLGGSNFYNGERIDKPLIGKELKKKKSEDILRGISLMWFTSLIFFLLGVAICFSLNLLK
ncbi:MAG: cobalamin biosynthesis protein CobD [bacterium (Candidatus Ratteibacteria) CG_4_10_14_3_um_filter_41_18]|uniref:Cobalamin biosynthesis protein CobD n=1 Tax=bacterium (Candidatus Ratteibacteria) CG_4_10_14_3_um_filter_41_18 TaxID=2014287 RepID=A0A2M7M1Z5_9BACT|nr:MAG: cobalamin biosynthesis protein CobD [bacterium (Candidatus Ratteibacteria) CG_4_10_14_3_um_filter_41_18]